MPRFLALYVGSPPPGGGPPPDLSEADMARGMAAWQAWMSQHAAAIVDAGGPLGKTKKASKAGVADTRNNVAGYIVIEAASHDDAVKMFEGHPHFAIFPGEGVEVMPILPIPGS